MDLLGYSIVGYFFQYAFISEDYPQFFIKMAGEETNAFPYRRQYTFTYFEKYNFEFLVSTLKLIFYS